MTTSFLSRRIRRTSELLKKGAEDRITEYERRFGSLAGLYDRLLSSLMVSNFSHEKAYETALKFFGSNKVRFASVDGTMYSNPLYDLMIFFGGAYIATGMENVPIFIHADNAEKELEKFLVNYTNYTKKGSAKFEAIECVLSRARAVKRVLKGVN